VKLQGPQEIADRLRISNIQKMKQTFQYFTGRHEIKAKWIQIAVLHYMNQGSRVGILMLRNQVNMHN
jgi:hypothetical protein